jgi:hypothetical protein
MALLMRFGRGLPSTALVLASGALLVAVLQSVAFADGCAGAGQQCSSCGVTHPPSTGTWGLWKFGQSAGYYGFGLGYHLGNGYGGDALGVHPDGGYPFYGGPGYPACDPPLRRFGHINPFPYNGGPGYPSPAFPNAFGGTGPLVPDQPVVTLVGNGYDGGIPSGFGPYTGGVPDAEAMFASSTIAASAAGSAEGRSRTPPAFPSSNAAPAPGIHPSQARVSPPSDAAVRLSSHTHSLGIEVEEVTASGGLAGIKVSKVHPGGAADQAGLHPGDLIQSINGYRTTQPGNLTWILGNAATDDLLVMHVHTANGRKEQTIRAQLR